MRPTMSDVAAAASVSKSTVSRALAGDARVKYETRVRIQQVAERLGYIPSFSATALARGRTWMIGVATPGTPRGFSDPFYLEFLGGLGDGAMRVGYNLIIAAPTQLDEADNDPVGHGRADRRAPAGDDQGRGGQIGVGGGDRRGGAAVNGVSVRGARGLDLEGLIAQGAVDAVALTEPAVDDPRLAVLRRYDVPFAFLGTCEEGGELAADASFVDGDNVGGAREAVEHLIALGHRRIACLAGVAGLVSTRHRLQGYRQAMQAAGLPVDDKWIVDGESTKQGGRRAMEILLGMGLGQGDSKPTAVFACNDLMAVGALRAARDAGLAVPGDVSVVGFDGIPLAEMVEPALTTVQQPIYDLGRRLADVLLSLLEDARQADGGHQNRPVRRHVVPCRLVVRKSTGPPRVV